MKTVVYMVRHAHSEFNIKEEQTRGLSDKGWKDAEKITEILTSETIDTVVSSSYTRAIQTVQGIADLIGTQVEIDKRFRERDLASADYRFDDIETAMQLCFNSPDFSHPGGESNNKGSSRPKRCFGKI
jgi:2,3-bisphosphoglycerate-dependent phosphoglycerate mutase